MKPAVSFLPVTLVALVALAAPLVAQVAPTIVTPPADLTIVVGDYIYFTVTADGDDLNYQWQKNGGTIAGATDASYLKDPSTTADAGAYTAKVSNPSGAITSAVATLTVLIPPGITTQPLSKTVTAGSNVTFTVKGSGSVPLTYQWFQDNVAIGGATATNLTLMNVQPGDAGDYTVAVNNLASDYGASDAVSDPATLTVLVPPTIIDHPDSLEVSQGDFALFSVLADGTDTESCPLTYQWFFKGHAMTGETGQLLEVLDAYPGDEGDYYVTVANTAGTLASSNAFLIVNTPPVFTLNPASRTVYPGSNWTLTASASGTPPIAYQWYFNNTPVAGATNTSYAVFIASTAQRGNYSVVASNLVDDTWSLDAYLTVKAEAVLPTVSYTFPTENQRWSNSIIVLQGVASDNAAVDFVDYDYINAPAGASFQRANAGFTNLNPYTLIWTNWNATYAPKPGSNLVRAVSTDDSANRSTTASRNFFYVVPSPFTLVTNGLGSASTNLGPYLEIGTQYTLTALPGPGFVFTNWTGGYTSNNATIKFMMKSNLVLNMNFLDVQKPVVTVTNPLPNGTLGNAQAIVSGSATDNWQVASIKYQFNSNAWAVATGTTNWTTTVTLVTGTNTFSVYSLDAGGNASLTNTSTTTVTIVLTPPNATSITRNGTTVNVSVASVVGLSYNLEYKDSLTNAVWTSILPPVAGTGGTLILSDTNATSASRYYRVRAQ